LKKKKNDLSLSLSLSLSWIAGLKDLYTLSPLSSSILITFVKAIRYTISSHQQCCLLVVVWVEDPWWFIWL